MWAQPQLDRRRRKSTIVRNILVTGASRGLGEALAYRYASPGHHLGLLARDREKLEAVATVCRERGASVTTGLVDVTTREELTSWIHAFDAVTPIDLLIVNAGIFNGHGLTSPESCEEMSQLLRTNLEGAILTINAALPMLRRRRCGTIAIIGSLAALYPLADAPAYSASKSGLMSYGEALREWLLSDRIKISLVYPGHIRTQQVLNHVGPLPLLMSADRAAERIKRGIDNNRSVIAFPSRLYWLVRLSRLIPWRLRALLGASARFHVAK